MKRAPETYFRYELLASIDTYAFLAGEITYRFRRSLPENTAGLIRSFQYALLIAFIPYSGTDRS